MKFRPLISVLVFAPSCLLFAESPVSRVWTNTAGRTLEGILLEPTSDSVKVKLKTGATVTLPLATLSKADQDYVEAQKKTAESAKSAPKPGEMQTGTKWPDKVILKELPEITIVEENDDTKSYIYMSPHYEFRAPAKLGGAVVKEFARIFEATYQANWALPLDFKPEPEEGRERFLCQIFEEYKDYVKAGGVEGSAGVYNPASDSILVPLKSLGVKFFGKKLVLERGDDNSTLIHEITHQMMNHWNAKLPVWYIEGSAEYVAMAKYERGNMSFTNPGRNFSEFLKSRGSDGKSWEMVPLEKLMTMDHATWAGAISGSGGVANRNYGSAAALTFYFYHLDDKGDATHVVEFIKGIGKGDNAIKGVAQNLLRERSYDQLTEEFEKSMRKQGVKISWAGK